MNFNTYLDPFLETLGREALQQVQLKKFQLMLDTILPKNGFYSKKFASLPIASPTDIRSYEELRLLPFTTKSELSSDQAQNPPYGSNLTFERNQYTRVHQTSGTTGEPLRCLDTEESWAWWARSWKTVYHAAGVTASDRIFFAFSFGPFIGFWSAYEGARLIGALSFPGGGMSSYQRVKSILANDISVLVCTPTYALHLAEVAEHEGLDVTKSGVRTTIHAGEPGASLPGTKARIEELWGARCFDHAGATEVGAWGFGCSAQRGLHVNEAEFIAEVIDPVTGAHTREGELVITNLGRHGMPVIRYRTGDRVRLSDEPCPCGRTYLMLEGGVIGRVDDVIIIRGVNVFPSAIENIVRRFPEVTEFAVDVLRRNELDELAIRIETSGNDAEVSAAIEKEIRAGLGLRVHVAVVPVGTLPRFDLKARRFNDQRTPKPAGVRG
jgi:phenylacetate-CoA ligase